MKHGVVVVDFSKRPQCAGFQQRESVISSSNRY